VYGGGNRVCFVCSSTIVVANPVLMSMPSFISGFVRGACVNTRTPVTCEFFVLFKK